MDNTQSPPSRHAAIWIGLVSQETPLVMRPELWVCLTWEIAEAGHVFNARLVKTSYIDSVIGEPLKVVVDPKSETADGKAAREVVFDEVVLSEILDWCGLQLGGVEFHGHPGPPMFYFRKSSEAMPRRGAVRATAAELEDLRPLLEADVQWERSENEAVLNAKYETRSGEPVMALQLNVNPQWQGSFPSLLKHLGQTFFESLGSLGTDAEKKAR